MDLLESHRDQYQSPPGCVWCGFLTPSSVPLPPPLFFLCALLAKGCISEKRPALFSRRQPAPLQMPRKCSPPAGAGSPRRPLAAAGSLCWEESLLFLNGRCQMVTPCGCMFEITASHLQFVTCEDSAQMCSPTGNPPLLFLIRRDQDNRWFTDQGPHQINITVG